MDRSNGRDLLDGPGFPPVAGHLLLRFQLNDHIARNILKQPSQNCNYAGNREVGAFLRRIMEKGATEDWLGLN
jgi:hypothetical protein